MRHAEEVTFGGSGLDRAGEIRGDAKALAAPGEVVVLWRGKLLVSGDYPVALYRVAQDHPMLEGAVREPVLLGRENKLVWAADISSWEPEALDESAHVHARSLP